MDFLIYLNKLTVRTPILIAILNLMAFIGMAQDRHPVFWKISVEKTSKTTYKVKIDAAI